MFPRKEALQQINLVSTAQQSSLTILRSIVFSIAMKACHIIVGTIFRFMCLGTIFVENYRPPCRRCRVERGYSIVMTSISFEFGEVTLARLDGRIPGAVTSARFTLGNRKNVISFVPLEASKS